MQHNDIVVFYLARLAEGFGKFQRFANSYQKHPAGINHRLVIIAKGFSNRFEYEALSKVFKDIPHTLISVDDDIGQDIHSYKVAAQHTQCEYACFLNTYTELRTKNWLNKLYSAISLPDVGLAGATGSFESLFSLLSVLHRAQFLLPKIAFNKKFLSQFDWILDSLHPPSLRASKKIFARVCRRLGDILYNRPEYTSLLTNPGCKTELCLPPDSWANFSASFPNPHIRSNAFIIRRNDFLNVQLGDAKTKLVGLNFESGKSGLSASILRSNKKLIVVGADGRHFLMKDWPLSGGYRSGTQDNLLASDNQTEAYTRASVSSKKTLRIISWGGYLKGGNDSLLGVPFDRKCTL